MVIGSRLGAEGRKVINEEKTLTAKIHSCCSHAPTRAGSDLKKGRKGHFGVLSPRVQGQVRDLAVLGRVGKMHFSS